MTSRPLQIELSLAALRLQTSQDELCAEIKKLQYALTQLNQALRRRLECPHTAHTHPTGHTSNNNSTKVTNGAQGLRSNATTSKDSNHGIVTEDVAPAEISIPTAESHFPTPAQLNTFTYAAGILAYNTKTYIAFSVDSAILKISLSANLLPSTPFAVFLLLLATNLHLRLASFTAFPAPTVLPTPRPPPEPDPNHEGRSNKNDNCGNTKIIQQ